MNILLVLLISLVFILAFIIVPYYECKIRQIKRTEPKNKVHFYVARDADGSIYLYLGKPERWRSRFSNFHGTCRNFTANEYHFEDVGLNPDDFKNLKWEDEPIEVFLNLED